MHLALPPHHDLVRLGIVHDNQRRILVDQLVQRLPELHVVLALLGGNRDREHRRIRRDLRERLVRLLAGGQRVAGLGVIELAESDCLARSGGAALLVVWSRAA